MTILLGIASAQQLDIKGIKEDLPVIKERIGYVETNLTGFSSRSMHNSLPSING